MTPDTAGNFPQRITFADAQRIVSTVAHATRLPIERIAVEQAGGRVLAEELVAGIALPSFDNSAMDGFALRACDQASDGETCLRLVGEQFAGRSLALTIAAGECTRITTGAQLPAGADSIVMKEHARVEGDQVWLQRSVAAGTHVRRAGEDVQPGDHILAAGERLTPAQASLAASLGMADLAVHRRPTVAVFTTGDELRAPGQTLAPGEIYDSNRTLLQNLLRAEGLDPVAWPILPDDPARMRALLRDAADAFDVVITCGGVSAGEKDFLPQLLSELGRIHFWKVLMRPGMPLLFGDVGKAQVLGLPGNPVSVLATFLTCGRDLLNGMQGLARPRQRLHARLTRDLRKAHDRREFLRGRLDHGDDAILRVTPHPADGSHRLLGAADSDCLLVLPEATQEWVEGDIVEVLHYA